MNRFELDTVEGITSIVDHREQKYARFLLPTSPDVAQRHCKDLNDFGGYADMYIWHPLLASYEFRRAVARAIARSEGETPAGG